MSYRAILPILLILLLAAACTAPAAAPVGQPAGAPAVNRDYSSTRTGDNGILHATYTSELSSLPSTNSMPGRCTSKPRKARRWKMLSSR